MGDGRPPPHPPDAAGFDADGSSLPVLHWEMNAEAEPYVPLSTTVVDPPILTPRMRVVTVEVRDCVNASRFLFDLLSESKAFDPSFTVLGHPDSPPGTRHLFDPSDIPADATQQALFVTNYLGGLRIEDSTLKCKIWFNSDRRLSEFKKNRQFRHWLNNNENGGRIQLGNSTLSGATIFPVGFFLYTRTRYDCVDQFTLQITAMLQSGSQLSLLPPFQIQVQAMHRKHKPDSAPGPLPNVYSMTASSKDDASLLTSLLTSLLPHSLNTAIKFIPTTSWNNKDLFSPQQKKDVLLQQSRFDATHYSTLITGSTPALITTKAHLYSL
jgi:hypothetical protein